MDGKTIYNIADEIYPICRSITGNGVRETLKILQKYCPELTIYEIPSGTKAFDWSVPDEWNIEEAYIEDQKGNRIIDFKENNLHVVGYSLPMDKWLTLEELKQYVYTLPEQPSWIPYVTSYYKGCRGFCMSQEKMDSLNSGMYHAVIKSSLNPHGSMTYGEIIFKGRSEKEIFFSSYICHPSMANNECSGPSVMMAVAEYIRKIPDRKYTYRMILVPETIGSITYLSKNLDMMKKNIVAGFNVTCVGDTRQYSIVHSRYGDTMADRILMNVLKHKADEFKEFSFLDRGSDERQYCAPGIDLPLCTFCRSKFYEYPEYHTSADDMKLISPEGLQGAAEVLCECIQIAEWNSFYKLECLCEPQLGRRGLYPTISKKGQYKSVRKIQDFLLYADGHNDLIDISNIIQVPAQELIPMIQKLLDNKLVSMNEGGDLK